MDCGALWWTVTKTNQRRNCLHNVTSPSQMDSLVGIFWIFVKLAAAKHTASTTSSTSILPEEEQPTKLDYVVQETLHTVDFFKKVVLYGS